LQRPAIGVTSAAALPGGDPLAAALAAGETPSPEMVAAAQKKGLKIARSRLLACFIPRGAGTRGLLTKYTPFTV